MLNNGFSVDIIQLSELSENYNLSADAFITVVLYNYLNCQRTITEIL